MGGKDSKLMDDVIKVTTVMKDSVIYVQKGVKTLDGVHGMKEVLNQFATVHDQLDKEQREVLETLITALSQFDVAVHFSRVAVRTCKSIAETVRRVITAEQREMSDKLKLAIRVYVKRVKELMPQLDKARYEFAQTQVGLKNAIGGFKILKEWCELKISEMEKAVSGKSKGKTLWAVKRAIAYGGTAGAATGLAVGAFVADWLDPFSCGYCAVVIGGATAVVGGVNAVVTEGKALGDLRKEYVHGITSLNEAIKSFEEMSHNAEENVRELQKKKEQIKEFVAVAQQIALNREMSITFDDEFMFNIFKEDVLNLEELCDNYLNATQVHKE